MLNRLKGDYDWLQQRLSDVELAVQFLLNLMDNNQFGMVQAPGNQEVIAIWLNYIDCKGSLWIDVFKRGNFTSDSNAMMVHLLEEVAEAEDFYGRSSMAQQYRKKRTTIIQNMNKFLWSTEDDHYITQVSIGDSDSNW